MLKATPPSQKIKLLSFSPYIGIWQHSYPEAVILDSLKKIANVTYIVCDGIFADLCVTMQAHGKVIQSSLEGKEKICHECKQKKRLIQKSFDFNYILLEELITDEDKKNITKILKKINRDNYLSYEINSIKVGKISLYDVILRYKKSNFILEDEHQWNFYKTNIKNSLYTYFAIENLTKSYIPDRVFIYNNLYPTNNVAYQYFKQFTIPIYNLHAGLHFNQRLTRMIISKDTTLEYLAELKKHWPLFKEHILTSPEAKSITKHFEQIIASSSIFNFSNAYENNFDFYQCFPLAKGKKVFLATLSSQDENFAYTAVGHMSYESVHGGLFKTQTEWLHWLINFFIKHPEYFLIIRLHPREFPNRRSKKQSESATIYLKLLEELPENIALDNPKNNINIYNLALETDVLLNSSSSTSLDFLFLGIPAVIYDENIMVNYPKDLHYHGCNEDDYILAINLALKDSWQFKNIYKLYKWMNIYLNLSIFDIKESTNLMETSVFPNEKQEKNPDNLYRFKRDLNYRSHNLTCSRQLNDFLLKSANTRLDLLSPETNGDDSKLIFQEMKKIYETLLTSIPNSKLAKNYNNFLIQIQDDK